MAKGLTQRQAEILDFIIESIHDNGMPPTIAEIGSQFHITSTNGVADHLAALERKGYIERSSKARSIRVTPKASAGLYQTRIALVPLVGRIAAGAPLLAEENIDDYIPVTAGYGKEGAYALRVWGDSMIEDGIFEGDVLIVDPTQPVQKGSIVVALVEGEATVKRYYRHGDRIELRPANAALSPIIVPASAVTLQGVVVALQRALG